MSIGLVQRKHRLRLDGFVEDYRKSSYAVGDDGGPLAIVPSPIDEDMVYDHENLLGAALPPLFRTYLTSWSLPRTDLYVGQLPLIPPAQPFEWVERWSIAKMEQPFYRRNERLVPFVHGLADCSDLCFDIYRPDGAGDYPIIKVWYGHLGGGDAEWSDADCEQSQVFGGFSEYLDYLQEWLIYETAGSEFLFEEWLQARGSNGPRSYYYDTW